MSSQTWRILLVDDDPDDFALTRALLNETDGGQFALEWVDSLSNAWKALEAGHYDAVLVDYNLGKYNGVEFVREAGARGYACPMILLTGQGSYSVDVQAMQAGAVDYLSKNEVTPSLLERTVRYAVERKQIEADLQRARDELELRVQERTYELQQAKERLEEANDRLQASNAALRAEVQERLRVEESLREREARLSIILEQLPAVLWSTDTELRFTSSLGRGLASLGLQPDQVVGMSMEEFGQRLAHGRATVEAHRRALQGETIDFTDQAEGRIFEGHVAPLHSAGGEIIGSIGLALDSTDRIRAMQDLRESEERLRAVVNSASVILWAIDRQDVVTLMEGKGLSAVGLRPGDNVGMRVEHHLDRRPDLRRCIEQALSGEEVHGVHPSLFNPQEILETHFTPHYDPQGEIVGVIGVSTLITDRVQAEARLAYQAHLLENVNDAILATDAQFNLTSWNRAAEQIYGWKAAEVLGRYLPDLLQTEFKGLNRLEVLRRLNETGQFTGEVVQRRRDGRPVSIEVRDIALKDDAGQVTGYASVNRDITERLLAESALRDSEARFRTVFEETALGIALKDLDGRILASNPALQELLGVSGAELRNMSFTDITDPQDVESEKALFARLRTGEIDRYRMEKRYLTRDGARVWSRLAVSLVRDEDGLPQFAVFLVENIQERKQMEAELAEVRRRLTGSREEERMELARDLHDGPMQELYGVVFQLSDLEQDVGEGSAVQAEWLEKLHEVREHILNTVQELRLFCSELRPPTLAPFGLEATLRSHTETFQVKHPEIDLQLDLRPDGQALAESLRLALFRIYQQSLANIVRHSRASQVNVRFSFDADQAVLEIEDNGRGFDVPPRWIDFVRRGHLGLAGAAERVEAIGGNLQVESAAGRGTTIRVIAPMNEI